MNFLLLDGIIIYKFEKDILMISEKEEMNKISNNNDIDLEYVYMGMLNDENMMGVQPIYDTNISIKGNWLIQITKK